MRDFEEQLDILFPRVLQQEGANRLAGFFDGLLLGERSLLQRGPGLVVDLRDDRADDEQAKEQGQADEDLVRGSGLRAQRLPQKMQHDGDAQERRYRHDGGRQQRQQRQQNGDLHGDAGGGAAFAAGESDAEERICGGRRSSGDEQQQQD